MARKQVLEVICDRCNRVETQEFDQNPKAHSGGDVDEMVLRFHSRTIKYGDLCIRCRKAVEGYIKQIAKEVESKPREGSKKTSNESSLPKKPILLGRTAG